MKWNYKTLIKGNTKERGNCVDMFNAVLDAKINMR